MRILHALGWCKECMLAALRFAGFSWICKAAGLLESLNARSCSEVVVPPPETKYLVLRSLASFCTHFLVKLSWGGGHAPAGREAPDT
jgi:hypothetical protein